MNRLFQLALFTLTLMTTSAYAANSAPATIRIAVPDAGGSDKHAAGGVIDVIREQHLLEKAFEKDKITIEWRFFKGAGPVINEALANDQVDIAYMGDLAAIVGKAGGLDTRVLSVGVRGIKSYLAVRPGSEIKQLSDLKGKRIAVFRGTALQLSFVSALASQGLSERDVKVINLDPNAANAALAAGQIDGTWGLSNLIVLQQRGLAELPVNSKELQNAGSTQIMLLGTGKFVRDYPELVTRLLEVQKQASDWLRDERNKKTYIELFTKNSSWPPYVLETELADEDLATYFDPRLDADFVSGLQKSIELAFSERLIRRRFEARDWVEPSYMNKVMAEKATAKVNP
ncbi:ABC transporter substrate-binding protein [Pseudomonas sp. S32]|uniref:ABC transporter substrate-binding protein n=1 Tax=Pseudomonas sp. S32 TaxID=2767448 RepID=UPI0019133E80|nr:ABC transporter substrate-binding protein [Pseudomonas sp. S32]MBK5006916.1 ABC transporter substrate-binding protein [Pseudomonas sp. S32]